MRRGLNDLLNLDIDEISEVRFEYRPPIKDFYKTGSAFDCFIAFSGQRGPGFLGIETKYSENLGDQQVSKNPSYAEITALPDSGFKEGAATRLAKPVTSQLWYNAVLAHRTLKEGKYEQGHALLLACRGDDAAFRAAESIQSERDSDRLILSASYEDFWKLCLIPTT